MVRMNRNKLNARQLYMALCHQMCRGYMNGSLFLTHHNGHAMGMLGQNYRFTTSRRLNVVYTNVGSSFLGIQYSLQKYELLLQSLHIVHRVKD